MNLFLSKYYLLEKATLPELISAQTIEALAQRDIPGIFMAMKWSARMVELKPART